MPLSPPTPAEKKTRKKKEEYLPTRTRRTRRKGMNHLRRNINPKNALTRRRERKGWGHRDHANKNSNLPPLFFGRGAVSIITAKHSHLSSPIRTEPTPTPRKNKHSLRNHNQYASTKNIISNNDTQITRCQDEGFLYTSMRNACQYPYSCPCSEKRRECRKSYRVFYSRDHLKILLSILISYLAIQLGSDKVSI